MRAGRLRHVITVQRQSDTKNGYGERVNTWTTLVTTRGSIEPILGREFLSQSGERAEITTKITIRYSSGNAGINPYDRISADGETYKIHSILNTQNRDRELVLMCSHDAS